MEISFIALLPAIIWTLLGIVFFTWLRWFAVKQITKKAVVTSIITAKKTKQAIIDYTPKVILTIAMLGPFLIGFSIVAINLFFG